MDLFVTAGRCKHTCICTDYVKDICKCSDELLCTCCFKTQNKSSGDSAGNMAVQLNNIPWNIEYALSTHCVHDTAAHTRVQSCSACMLLTQLDHHPGYTTYWNIASVQMQQHQPRLRACTCAGQQQSLSGHASVHLRQVTVAHYTQAPSDQNYTKYPRQLFIQVYVCSFHTTR